jgi:hypothetical protein
MDGKVTSLPSFQRASTTFKTEEKTNGNLNWLFRHNSRSKDSSHRKRSAESVSDVSEEKRPPCRGRRTNPKCDFQVIIEENPMTIDDS